MDFFVWAIVGAGIVSSIIATHQWKLLHTRPERFSSVLFGWNAFLAVIMAAYAITRIVAQS